MAGQCLFDTGDSTPWRGNSWEDNKQERKPKTLIASLTRTDLSLFLDVDNLELTSATTEKDSDKDDKGFQRQSATIVVKTPEHGELQMTDWAITTCRLLLRCHGVEHNPR